MAAYFEIDDVIDPADSRRWIATLFDDDAPAEGWRTRPAKRRPYVDAPALVYRVAGLQVAW